MRMSDPLARRAMTRAELAEIYRAKRRTMAIIPARYLKETPSDTLVLPDSLILDVYGVIWVKIFHPSLPVIEDAVEYPVVDARLNIIPDAEAQFPTVWKDGLGNIVDSPNPPRHEILSDDTETLRHPKRT